MAGVTEGLKLSSSLRDAVGGRTATALEKAFGYEVVHDLLLHLPRRYSRRGELTDLRSLRDGDHATVLARICAINTRPMRGVLLRASKAYHWPPRYASNHALKSIGAGTAGTPMSPR